MITQDDAKKGLINDQMGTQLESLSAQVEAGLERGKNAWADWRATLSDSSAKALSAADGMVRERPWQIAAGAAAVGLLLGMLVVRKR